MAPGSAGIPGETLPAWSLLPFAGILLAIAFLPLAAPRFWARRYGLVSLAFGLPVAAWFLFENPRELLRTAGDYASFIVLLSSLFTVSGGILVRGAIRATPAVNGLFLGFGAIAANLLGTTGASMLLVRPLLRANAHRRSAGHVFVFFIFVVSNIGGLLTPIGDPPLFLGYLAGVPFFWTLRRLWPLWLAAVGIVIAVFCVLDRRIARNEAPAPGSGGGTAGMEGEAGSATAALSIEGKGNLALIAAVIGAVFLPSPLREVVMTAAAALSVRMTPARIREENGFTWHPIREVAVLFAGIFATMMPALMVLSAHAGGLGIASPRQFFWATGALSSVLDNAPTYLAFLSIARGAGGPAEVAGAPAAILGGISAGAVFMGANSYIGNAPNFMVKAIAEGAGVRMPSFLGYMGWAALVLLPVFALVSWIFL